MGLPFTPAPFFADKDRAFWRLQLVGWGGSALLRATTNIANGKPEQLVLTLIATVTGFSISLILSVIYGKLINRRPLITWSVTALALSVAVVISSAINGWTLSLSRVLKLSALSPSDLPSSAPTKRNTVDLPHH